MRIRFSEDRGSKIWVVGGVGGGRDESELTLYGMDAGMVCVCGGVGGIRLKSDLYSTTLPSHVSANQLGCVALNNNMKNIIKQ